MAGGVSGAGLAAHRRRLVCCVSSPLPDPENPGYPTRRALHTPTDQDTAVGDTVRGTAGPAGLGATAACAPFRVHVGGLGAPRGRPTTDAGPDSPGRPPLRRPDDRSLVARIAVPGDPAITRTANRSNAHRDPATTVPRSPAQTGHIRGQAGRRRVQKNMAVLCQRRPATDSPLPNPTDRTKKTPERLRPRATSRLGGDIPEQADSMEVGTGGLGTVIL